MVNQNQNSQYIPPAIAAYMAAHHWENTSWGNDVCASFVSPCSTLNLWVDCKDKDARELEEPRFSLFHYDCINECCGDLIITRESETGILKALIPYEVNQ